MSVNQRRSIKAGRPSDKVLVDGIARAIIRKHNVVSGQVDSNRGWDGYVEQLCLKRALSLNGQTLGRVVMAFPEADLHGVHCGTWLGKYESGPYLLQQIAATAILWRIRVILGVREDIADDADRHTDRLPWVS